MRINRILRTKPFGHEIEVKGWVRTRRDSKTVSFIEINDGSCLENLQVVIDPGIPGFNSVVREINTGCAVTVHGVARKSPARGQEVEVEASSIALTGGCDPTAYPLQKKRHSLEFLRTISHLRPRSNVIGAITRIRSRLSFAVHRFFNDRGFCQIHTPIITAGDCEGAGEIFQVTTGRNDDFFGRDAGLTVSGQLEAEAYALALGRVYTFGPTFRAENSNTSRHLAEFWMIEPEMAFCDLDEDIDIAEEFLKYLILYAFDNCSSDLSLFSRFVDRELKDRLQRVLEHDFVRVTYTEAVELLEKSGKNFQFPAAWGMDLQSEHERYLCEEVFNAPVVVTGYPAAIKPFYMRRNDDGRTVAAMDILFPGVGEIAGGSQREERYEQLKAAMRERNMDMEAYQWYLDLRRFGSAHHAGFGVGFERLLLFVTGLGNIRDVIPFPRTPGSICPQS